MAGSLDPSNLSYTVLVLGNESDPIDPLPQDPNNNVSQRIFSGVEFSS